MHFIRYRACRLYENASQIPKVCLGLAIRISFGYEKIRQREMITFMFIVLVALFLNL